MAGRDSIPTAAGDPERMRREMANQPVVYVAPAMPGSLSKIRTWLRQMHDAYNDGFVTVEQLREARRSAMAFGDLHRVAAEMRKADAAMATAAAQVRMADTLAAVEFGGAAPVMLARLQDSISAGRRKPLPGRVLSAVARPAEAAAL